MWHSVVMICSTLAAITFPIKPCYLNKELTWSFFFPLLFNAGVSCLTAVPVVTTTIVTTTTSLSAGVSHVRRCNDSEKAYCVNGGDCYFIHGINQPFCK